MKTTEFSFEAARRELHFLAYETGRIQQSDYSDFARAVEQVDDDAESILLIAAGLGALVNAIEAGGLQACQLRGLLLPIGLEFERIGLRLKEATGRSPA